MATTDSVTDAAPRVTLPPGPWRAVEHTLAPGFVQAEIRDANGVPIATVRAPRATGYWSEIRDEQMAIAEALAGNGNRLGDREATQ